MSLISERNLAKAFVYLTFFGIGVTLIQFVAELGSTSSSSKPVTPTAAVESDFIAKGKLSDTHKNIGADLSSKSKMQNSDITIPSTDQSVSKSSLNSKIVSSTIKPTADASLSRKTTLNLKVLSTTAVQNGRLPQLVDSKPRVGSYNIPVSPKMLPTFKTRKVSDSQSKDAVITREVSVHKDSVHPDGGRLPPCPVPGVNLVGSLAVDQSIPNMEDIEKYWDEKGWLLKGGAWRPTTCQAVSKVAVIVPYRNRYPQLKIFLRHMHPILKRQMLDYRIIVSEQNGDTPFNRAMLFNVGYVEALKFHDFQCFVFHDVDHIPENDKNYYGCPSGPRHLSISVDRFHYRLPYATMFGGVEAFRKEHFEKINGFSNKFWGWGGEDDDIYKRVYAAGFKLSRPPMSVGRYTMIRIGHKSAKADPERFNKLRDSGTRMKIDGLNSLKYEIVKIEEQPLYTHVLVNLNPDAV